MAAFKLLLCMSFLHIVFGKGSESQIECTPEIMKVMVPMDGDRQLSYLDQLKEYKPCKPSLEDKVATFMLDLQNPHTCGVTRVLNKLTGIRTFYHKIVIETAGGQETHTVRCVVTGKRVARAVSSPLDLIEPDVVNITRNEQGYAPEPILTAVVKQSGRQVTGEISVSPGTPLSMEINLDDKSKPVYGLLVNYMHVTDTGKQQETIILNGCSVDPYLFDNFVTTDGDVLSAKFRAFKFPDTSYVQFKGTVTVCLDKCQGVQCSNGVVGYGRKRRAIDSGADANKVYEVSLTTFIKVEWKEGEKQAVVEQPHLGIYPYQRSPQRTVVRCAFPENYHSPIEATTPPSGQDVLAILKHLKVANQRLGEDEQSKQSKLVVYTDRPNSSSILRSSFVLVISLILVLFK